MGFLNARSVGGWHIDQMIAKRLHFAPCTSRKTNGYNSLAAGRFESFDNIHAVSGSTQTHQNITAAADTFKQSRINNIITVIVSNGSEVGGVGMQCLGG